MTTTIEERVRILEDRERIRELAATYCFLVDDERFGELVERCFTEDASCDFHGAGGEIEPIIAKGREELLKLFSVMVGGVLRDMVHTVHNHRITIDGDRASGDCYFELTAIERATGEEVVGAGRYFDRYRRVEGSWRFEVRNADMFFIAPAKQGWSRQRFLSAVAQ